MTRQRCALRPHRLHQGGAGALIVVMVLFFVISLVAAYTNRNIIFEQKTSANQYRSTQAFEAAEAGVAWGLAMLNAGNIDSNCLPSPTGTSFRNRYLSINNSTGAILPIHWPDANTGPNDYSAMCVLTATGWSCNCPTNSAPTLSPPTPTAPAPAFVVQISNAGNGPGFFTLNSRGCISLNTNCATGGQLYSGDATAQINAVVALKGAIATPPAAALTSVESALSTPGNVDFSASGSLQVSNAEAQTNGTTIDAAGAVNYPTNMTLTSLPGTPALNSFAQSDPSLPVPFTDLPATANDSLFVQVFGMARSTYQQQPTTIVLTCPADCTATNLAAAAASNPGRTLWLAGDAALAPAAPMIIGSPTAPVVVVSDGNLTVSGSPLTIYGLLYVYDDNAGSTGVWTTGGNLSVTGATVVEGNITGPGTLALSYSNAINPATLTSPGILNQLRLATGAFVRLPGGWLDVYIP